MALAVVLVALAAPALATEEEGTYTDAEPMILWLNKIGPFHNPQETYPYYHLPYCSGKDKVEHRHENLGEALLGYELVNSGIGILFKQDVPSREICSIRLDQDSAKAFADAVAQHYWYEMFLDELPIWAMVGEMYEANDADDVEGPEVAFLYTHRRFSVSFNGDQVIEVNMTSENPKPIKVGVEMAFTYSVEWRRTTTPFEERFFKYYDEQFFEHDIHWFSIFNSFMMVIFLVGLVALILVRTLKRDYAKYRKDDDEADDFDHDIGDESGWKQVHGDVFRAPTSLVLFSAMIGTGFQLTILALFLIVATIMGSLHVARGTLLTVSIFCYAFTSFMGGFYGGGYYKQNQGESWIKTMILTAGLFPGIVFGLGFLLNFVAISYGSLAAIPFTSILILMLIWAFIAFPLTLLGTLVGRNLNGEGDWPCHIKTVPRPIPDAPWYMTPTAMGLLGGILPFGSIFIETYFLFTSFWHYKWYYVYGFLLLVFVILVVVAVCVTIVSTYFLLNAENYHWQWNAFFSGASTGLYVFVYSIYYFVVKTLMSGFFQTCFYFGYILIICAGVSAIVGTVGFIGSSIFVRRIYEAIKAD